MAVLHLHTPVGWLCISGTARAICSVRFVATPIPEGGSIPQLLRTCAEQLEAYFGRTQHTFELPLDYGDAPPFYRKVWDALQQIPYGHTTSYQHLARQLGKPRAARAVGQASRANPLAILVPCHRVIASSGALQGYFYGLHTKRYLLRLENPCAFATQGTLF